MTPEMTRLVRELRLGYVATVSEDGAPNLSPKGSLTALDEDTLVFADVDSPHTVRNLGSNPRIEVNVVDPFTRRGYRFRGKGTVLHSGTNYWKVLELYRDEGADVRRIRSVVMVEVEEASSLVSPIYAGGASEDDIRPLWEEYYSSTRKRTVLDQDPPRDF
jgi:predicted pyridoxine 5'-phosphate oxidase superfamily flavin-nucleotide-binding protein